MLAELPDMGAETRTAIDKAYTAQAGWAALTARDRRDMLWRWHQLIKTIPTTSLPSSQLGWASRLPKPKSEVSHAAAYLQWYAKEANRIHGETIPPPSTDRGMPVIKQPIGVVGTITLWNFLGFNGGAQDLWRRAAP
ncbi:aldehyde dehydrogenase family protein [Aminobacter sp. BA135]|uniref:aldehyde dehydrogenase family protein n=1 Tax=Aminobacter sp. BA135 TaxID=537596 RepID=UPI003D79041C